MTSRQISLSTVTALLTEKEVSYYNPNKKVWEKKTFENNDHSGINEFCTRWDAVLLAHATGDYYAIAKKLALYKKFNTIRGNAENSLLILFHAKGAFCGLRHYIDMVAGKPGIIEPFTPECIRIAAEAAQMALNDLDGKAIPCPDAETINAYDLLDRLCRNALINYPEPALAFEGIDENDPGTPAL